MLNRLQQIDMEIQARQQRLYEIQGSNDDKGLLEVEAEFVSREQQLSQARKEQKDSEWELEDLEAKARQSSHKLYSGTTKNPKELANLESEVRLLKGRISKKEDELLQLMNRVEEIEAEAKTYGQEFQRLKQEWKRRQENIDLTRGALEGELGKLWEIRRELAQPIPSEIMGLYEQIRLTKGQVVAKVEQGRCHGCHIILPTSQWQRAKAGDLVQCNSCGRILYVE